MQRPIQGMTGNDQHILRLLAESELVLRVGDIQYNLDWKYDVQVPESTLYRRLGALEHSGLIDEVTDSPSRYIISQLGKRYLDGDLSDQEAENIETAYDNYEY